MLEMQYTNQNLRAKTRGLKFWLQVLAFPMIFGIIYVVSLIINSEPDILSKLGYFAIAILALVLFVYLATYFNHSRRWQEILFQPDAIQIKYMPSSNIQTISKSEIRAITLKTPTVGTSGYRVGFTNADLKVIFDLTIKTISKTHRISDIKCHNLPQNSSLATIIDLYKFCMQNYEITPNTNIIKIDNVIERLNQDNMEKFSET